jgi:hypothetical protein
MWYENNANISSQSNLANKLDPTVDSDLDGRRNIVSSNRTSGAHGNTNTSTSGGISTSTNAGPHNVRNSFRSSMLVLSCSYYIDDPGTALHG